MAMMIPTKLADQFKASGKGLELIAYDAFQGGLEKDSIWAILRRLNIKRPPPAELIGQRGPDSRGGHLNRWVSEGIAPSRPKNHRETL